MKPPTFALAILLLLGVCHQIGQSQEVLRVGPYGNPTKFEFRGITTFDEADLRAALRDDLEVLTAGSPFKRRESFLRLVEQRLTEGYRFNGFPAAKVEAAVDFGRERVEIDVIEGPRYRSGEIVVTGCQQVSAVELIERLTHPQEPKSSTKVIPPADLNPGTQTVIRQATTKVGPLWKAEEFTNFSDAGKTFLETGIRAALEDQGFHFAKFVFDIEAPPNATTATLRIRLDEEGPIVTLGRVEVVGLQRHRPDEVLSFLQLKPGMPMKGLRASDLEHRLLQSARFTRQSVTLTKAKTTDAAIQQTSAMLGTASEVKSGAKKTDSADANKKEPQRLKLAFENPFDRETKSVTQSNATPANSQVSDPTTQSLDLKIEVHEYLSVPKLDEPLTREQQTLVRLAAWLENWATGDEDLFLKINFASKDHSPLLHGILSMVSQAMSAKRQPPSGQLDTNLVLSPLHGLLASVRYADQKEQVLCDVGLVLAAERVALYRPTVPMRLEYNPKHSSEFSSGHTSMQLLIEMAGANNPGEQGNSGLTLGLGINHRKDAKASPFTLSMKCAPVSLIALAITEGCMTSWDGATLQFENKKDGWHVWIDEHAGRLLECQRQVDGLGHKAGITLEVGSGRFEQTLRELDQQNQGIPNRFDTQAPLQSVLEVVGLSMLDAADFFAALAETPNKTPSPPITSQEAAGPRIVVKLLSRATNDVWQKIAQKAARSDDARPKFWIPPNTGTTPNLLASLSPLVLWANRELFAEDTWPWNYSRAIAFLLGHKSEPTQAAFEKLRDSRDTGPIGCWFIASTAQYHLPALRPIFAQQGLKRLDARSFRSDCDALLREDAPIGKLAERFVQLLRELPPAEVATLGHYLSEGEAESPMEASLRRLIEERDAPIRELLASVLDDLWRPVLSPKVEQSLKSLLQNGEQQKTQVKPPTSQP